MEDYYNAEMPGSRLNIRFHGNEKTPEQIFIMPFGDDVKYFMVMGCEGRQAYNKMQHGQDNGLGSIDRISQGSLGGAMGRHAIQAEGRRYEHAIKPEPASQHPIFIFPPFFSR